MNIVEQNILRLTIEHDNTPENNEREKVFYYLDERFGPNRYYIVRSGPKVIGAGMAVPGVGKMIVDVMTD